MRKTLLLLLLITAISFSADRTEDYNNVRYSYVSATETLTVSPVDPTKEAKIDNDKFKEYRRKNLGVGNYNLTINISKGVKFPDDSSRLFYNFGGTLNIDSSIDTSNVVNMSEMFVLFSPKNNVNLNSWNLTNVRNMSGMFRASNLSNVQINQWDVSHVEDMSNMFASASGIKDKLNNWNVSNVTNMSGMFKEDYLYRQTDLTNVNLSRWNVSRVKNMSSMFAKTEISSDIGIGNWNVSNVRNMSNMFIGTKNSENLGNIDLSKWDVSRVTDMSSMFSFRNLHSNIGIENWNVRNVTNMSYMFSNVTIDNLDLRKWNISSVKNMGHMFSVFRGKVNFDYWNVSNVTNMDEMLWMPGDIDISTWTISSNTPIGFVTEMYPELDLNQEIYTGEDIPIKRMTRGHTHVYLPDGISVRFKSPSGSGRIRVDTSKMGLLINSQTMPFDLVYNNKVLPKSSNIWYAVIDRTFVNNLDYNIDTSVVDKINEGFFIEGNLKHDYYTQLRSLVSLKKLTLKNLFGGLKIGVNGQVVNHFRLGTFLEYDYNDFHTIGLGGQFGVDYKNHLVDGFIRYRLNIFDKQTTKTTTNNVDAYLRYGYQYRIDSFYLRGSLGALASYNGAAKLEATTYIKRFIAKGDLGLRLGGKIGNTDIYTEGNFSVQYTTDQYTIEDRSYKINTSNVKLNGRLKLGLEHNIGKFKLHEDISFDYLGSLKANFGFGYKF